MKNEKGQYTREAYFSSLTPDPTQQSGPIHDIALLQVPRLNIPDNSFSVVVSDSMPRREESGYILGASVGAGKPQKSSMVWNAGFTSGSAIWLGNDEGGDSQQTR